MSFVPERGDLIWLDFDPHMGREQGRRRPALVLSPALYNGRTGLCVVCPISNQAKGYPFEVALTDDAGATGIILCDHLKSQDWRSRSARIIGTVDEDVVDEVVARLQTLLPAI